MPDSHKIGRNVYLGRLIFLSWLLPFGVLVLFAPTTAAAVVLFSIRAIQIIVISTIVSLMTGGPLSKCLTGALIGAILTEISWLALSIANQNFDFQNIITNPIIWIGTIACSSATAPTRISALITGRLLLFLAVLVWLLFSMRAQSNDPRPLGTGLAQFFLLGSSIAAILAGSLFSLVARFVYEEFGKTN